MNKIKLCCRTIAWKGKACAERPPKTHPAAISRRFVSAGVQAGLARLGTARHGAARHGTARSAASPPGPAAPGHPGFGGAPGAAEPRSANARKRMGFCCCSSHSWCLLRNDGFFSFHLFFFFFLLYTPRGPFVGPNRPIQVTHCRQRWK